MIQLSLTLHSLTKIQINVAKPRGWRNSDIDDDYTPVIPWHVDFVGEDASKNLDDFAHTIRLAISNFSFPDKKPSHWSLPMIEVEARFPRRPATFQMGFSTKRHCSML
jgi:hypothetical protein